MQVEFEPEAYEMFNNSPAPSLPNPPLTVVSDEDSIASLTSSGSNSTTSSDGSDAQDPEQNTASAKANSPFAPITLAIATSINETKGRFLFKALQDPGGSHNLIRKNRLPSNIEIFTSTKSFDTTAGNAGPTQYVYLNDFRLPEYSFTRSIKKVKFYLFDCEIRHHPWPQFSQQQRH